ncbi:S-protein homolog 6-like [Humulus lupulus]|uniref:S-protein homolog 6-like n=1 Tax=Humulus lupulus TaxID=3486 RepID=UPI002B40C80B|nr:S-protein homolog 6-like [Humulus lupulus]XP_062104452.1 S-protein homolog 6-like [Humulus lupulus]
MKLFEKRGFSLISLILIIMFSSSLIEAARVNLPSTNDGNNKNSIDDEKLVGVFVFNTTVQIFNNLDNQNQLTVHCKSADVDLGAHVVANNQDYEFEFRINFAGTTLYFCGLTWVGGTGSYDIFKASRDSSRCASKCVWRARNDGIYGYLESKNQTVADIIYKWS